MSLLPDRHPNLDFFVLDIADAVPKDDMASMEHPLFSLATKPDMRHLEYRSNDNVLKIRPSGFGLPTIFDKDILIFVISQLMHRKNRGETIGDTVRFSARELCIATNRQIGGDHYKRLENAFSRLQGTQFVTNVRTGGKIETRIFSLIDEGGFVRTDDERFRLDYCEVKLSRWLMRAIASDQVVTISNDYFRLRRPLERRLYEIARKHCGSKPKWQIGLTTLQNKTGSNAPIKRFRHNLREIIKADVTPFYWFDLDDSDLVTVRPRHPKAQITPAISLPVWAEEKARTVAQEKGRDYYALRADWLAFANAETAKGNPPKNVGAAFVAYCGKQESLR
ncbi:RepA [Paracoccus sp. S4493]|jgi:plasmid replication initiation protein|uniref:plasmid replication initiator TrfA n=1 Tax=Paracoccus sp. S4493 TaxID=579490 RepID=UPI0005FA24F9|nr:replication initiator protein A [Paracoccus sp. S4493]KJZ29981.1 RepA [Paracoccus sp. S4493]